MYFCHQTVQISQCYKMEVHNAHILFLLSPRLDLRFRPGVWIEQSIVHFPPVKFNENLVIFWFLYEKVGKLIFKLKMCKYHYSITGDRKYNVFLFGTIGDNYKIPTDFESVAVLYYNIVRLHKYFIFPLFRWSDKSITNLWNSIR